MTATATGEWAVVAEQPPTAPLPRIVIAVAAAKTAFFIATSGMWGIHRDEFYYLAGGRRLDWGYVDHPPITPLLYRIGEIVFGSSQVGLHTMPALLAGVLVVVAALLARELGGGRTAQIIAAMGVAVAPMFLTTSHFTVDGDASTSCCGRSAYSSSLACCARATNGCGWPSASSRASVCSTRTRCCSGESASPVGCSSPRIDHCFAAGGSSLVW